MTEQATGFHARAFRVIGQDLDDLIPHRLTIVFEDEHFVARVSCGKRRFDEQIARQSWSGLRRVGAKITETLLKAAREPDLEFVELTRSYSGSEIEQLDQQSKLRRTNNSGIPDIYTLAERLRAIGKLIDSEDGRLVKVFKDEQRVVIDYLDAGGSQRRQELNNTELFQIQTGYSSQRSPTPISAS